MVFKVYDFSEYYGFLDLVSADYESEASLSVNRFYDEERHEWDFDSIKAYAVETIRKWFGEDAEVEW